MPFPSEHYNNGFRPSFDNTVIPKNFIGVEKEPSRYIFLVFVHLCRNRNIPSGISSSVSAPLPSFIHSDDFAESYAENPPYYNAFDSRNCYSCLKKPLSSSQNLFYQEDYPSGHYGYQDEEIGNEMRRSDTFSDFDQSGYRNSFPSHNHMSQQGTMQTTYQPDYPRMNRNVMISPKPMDSNRISPFEENTRDDISYVSRGNQSYSSTHRMTRNKTSNKNSRHSSRKGNHDLSRGETPSNEPHNRERWSPGSIQLNDTEGNMLSLVKTRYGCLGLQNEIDRNGVMMIDKICKELGDDLCILLNNQYGNYLFQKMIANATDEQKYRIVRVMNGDCNE